MAPEPKRALAPFAFRSQLQAPAQLKRQQLLLALPLPLPLPPHHLLPHELNRVRVTVTSPNPPAAPTMGWFWGSSDTSNGDSSKDPLRNLDPNLRDFLAKESPVKYSSSNPPATPSPAPAPAPQSVHKNASAAPPTTSDEFAGPKVPPQSLFQDGRYADLWKTYQPQHDVEEQGKSDQEKINDVLEGYKYRKAEIGRAALENCALEQWQVNDCFRNGGWSSRLTLCRAENREFERCYLMQAVCRPRSICGRLLMVAEIS
jgi:hypothetical protein